MEMPFERQGREKEAVLFLCHHNAARSQMAEALLRARFPERYDVASAGVFPAGVHPLTLRVLEEAGISTDGLRSKHVQEYVGCIFDIVATVCAEDEVSCPFFPGGRHLHHAFDDPSSATGSDEERIAAFRRTRDEINGWIHDAFAPGH